jgi:hypothetical protein
LAVSAVTMRFGTPIWIAASPTPGASYIVSNMSSTSARTPASTVFTGSETSRSRLSGRMMISRNAMRGDLRGGGGAVNHAETKRPARVRRPRSRSKPSTMVMAVAVVMPVAMMMAVTVVPAAMMHLLRGRNSCPPRRRGRCRATTASPTPEPRARSRAGQRHQDELAHAFLSPWLIPRASQSGTVCAQPGVNAKVPVARRRHLCSLFRSR